MIKSSFDQACLTSQLGPGAYCLDEQSIKTKHLILNYVKGNFEKIAYTSLHIQDDGIVFTDDDTQQDMFNLDSDEEDDAEEDYDAKWRQQRFEREKFLQEQEASCN